MLSNLFSAEVLQETIEIVKGQFALAFWETLYVTVAAMFFAVLLGLPLGVLLVVGEKNGLAPLPGWLMKTLNVIINLLRSVPFLILMILLFPLTRAIIGTAVGTLASIVPLTIAAFPFVARLVESSLRELNPNIIEMSRSMGASPMQTIVKVMIPEAIPSLISNATIAITTILGYTAMSGIIGGGGLGKIAINYGYYRYKYLVMLLAVILLIVIVQIFQSVGTHLAVGVKQSQSGAFGSLVVYHVKAAPLAHILYVLRVYALDCRHRIQCFSRRLVGEVVAYMLFSCVLKLRDYSLSVGWEKHVAFYGVYPAVLQCSCCKYLIFTCRAVVGQEVNQKDLFFLAFPAFVYCQQRVPVGVYGVEAVAAKPCRAEVGECV